MRARQMRANTVILREYVHLTASIQAIHTPGFIGARRKITAAKLRI
jgi:hypothetical protein